VKRTPVRYLDIGEFLYIVVQAVGIRDSAVLSSPRLVYQADSALSAPAISFGGEDVYPTLVDKAAILLSRLIENRPVPMQNTAVAFLSMVEFLARNGCPFEGLPGDTNAGLCGFLRDVEAGDVAEASIIEWLRPRVACR
jgi:death-on-curing protein